MPVLVNHCYDWVGFHLINRLLEEGYSVVGIHDKESDLNDHLAMFLGRNSSFIEQDSMINHKTEFQAAIIFGREDDLDQIQTKRLFYIDTNNEKCDKANSNDQTVIIRPPILFGQWMPMNEKGMYHNGQFISFKSHKFYQHAIYVKDFVELLTQWLEYALISLIIELYSAHFGEIEERKLENAVYIHDNIPIYDKLDNVLEHYEKFAMFYEQ